MGSCVGLCFPGDVVRHRLPLLALCAFAVCHEQGTELCTFGWPLSSRKADKRTRTPPSKDNHSGGRPSAPVSQGLSAHWQSSAHKSTASPSPPSAHSAGMPPRIPRRRWTRRSISARHPCSSAPLSRSYPKTPVGSAVQSTNSHPTLLTPRLHRGSATMRVASRTVRCPSLRINAYLRERPESPRAAERRLWLDSNLRP